MWPALAPAFVVLAAACGGPAGPAGPADQASSASASGQAAPATADEIACVSLAYPCSLAETPPELIERTTELLAAARGSRREGSMADALEYLRAQPDVVEAFGSSNAIVFRVAGAAEAWFVDRTGQDAAPSATIPDVQLASSVVTRRERSVPLPSVVGEDTSGDGVVDNRDVKRALILAPYQWEFMPWDESDHLAERFDALPSYAGNVSFAANRTKGDQEVTIDHYRSFDDFDAVFLSTHGARACPDDDIKACQVVISTGLNLNLLAVQASGRLTGFVALGVHDDDAATSQAVVELGITDYFFRTHYPDGLDDTLLVLSACETGLAEGMRLATVAGGENFAMLGWSESVPSDAAFRATGLLAERLALGHSTEQAHQTVVEVGLDRATNGDGVEAVFELLTPGGGAVRLIELPTLLQDGEPMQDGANVSDLIPGQPGDGAPDRLQLSLQVAGVHEPMFYSVRYEIDGRPTSGEYDLLSARQGDLEDTYLVDHDVDVGFDLPPEGFTIEAIVDLPEGGESRYYVEVTVGVSCDLLPMPLPPGAGLVLKADTVIAEGDDTCLFTVSSYSTAVDFIRRELPDAGYMLTGEVSPRVPVDERNLRSIGWVISDGPGLCGSAVIGLIEHPDSVELDITVLGECE